MLLVLRVAWALRAVALAEVIFLVVGILGCFLVTLRVARFIFMYLRRENQVAKEAAKMSSIAITKPWERMISAKPTSNTAATASLMIPVFGT